MGKVKVLFAGDINVDIVLGGLESLPVIYGEITCSSFSLTMGSTSVFAACTYSSLGGGAGFTGLAGKDYYGEFMIRGMREYGIDTSLVQFTRDIHTGVTVNLVYGDTRTQITYPGTIELFDGAQLFAEHLKQYRHLHFAGVYLQHRFRPQLTALLTQAQKNGITTSLDPQWGANRRWDGMEEWLPLRSYVFMNEHEALSFTGKDTSEEAWSILAEKTSCPVIKAGKRGSVFKTRGAPLLVASFPVQVVDTIGAGDAFDAGFLFGVLEKGMQITEAARFGNAVGARNCTFRGGVQKGASYEKIIQFVKEKE